MDVFLMVVLLLLGLAAIIVGGNIIIKNAVKISDITGIPQILIGATIVSVATTLPELSVTIFSSLDNLNNMAMGNAIGSVIFNLTIIAGVCMLFCPQPINISNIKKDFFLLMFCTLLFFVLAVANLLNALSGIFLLIVFFSYFISNIIKAIRKVDMEDIRIQKVPDHYKKKLLYVAVFFVIGTCLITLGGKLLVENGERLASALNIGEHIIGVVVIAIGTSMPEIVTCITSIKYKSTSIVVGNIIGANILSFTLLLGTICLSSQNFILNSNLTYVALPTIFFATLLIYVPARIKNRIGRLQGAFLIALAIFYYLTLLFSN